MAEHAQDEDKVSRIFIDGISSIATHNNVHRIVCYSLTAAGQPVPCVELLISDTGVKNFANAISALSR
jgi:hypothetical protein